MDIIKIAKEFERREHSFKNPSDRIRASHEVKEIILVLSEIYEMGHDPVIMDLIKRLMATKKSIERKLRYKRPVV